jgi:hypothetical protein
VRTSTAVGSVKPWHLATAAALTSLVRGILGLLGGRSRPRRRRGVPVAPTAPPRSVPVRRADGDPRGPPTGAGQADDQIRPAARRRSRCRRDRVDLGAIRGERRARQGPPRPGDRPRRADRVFAVRLTSKAHDGDRDYLSIGTGPWDSQGRPRGSTSSSCTACTCEGCGARPQRWIADGSPPSPRLCRALRLAERGLSGPAHRRLLRPRWSAGEDDDRGAEQRHSRADVVPQRGFEAVDDDSPRERARDEDAAVRASTRPKWASGWNAATNP